MVTRRTHSSAAPLALPLVLPALWLLAVCSAPARAQPGGDVVVTSVSGCPLAVSVGASTNTSTGGCATVGGATLDIRGRWFNTTASAVHLGSVGLQGLLCTNVVVSGDGPGSGMPPGFGTRISCVLPAGVGVALRVFVQTVGAPAEHEYSAANANVTVSYAAPSILYLTGGLTGGADGDGSNAGAGPPSPLGPNYSLSVTVSRVQPADRITLVGVNFGQTVGRVLVGSRACTDAVLLGPPPSGAPAGIANLQRVECTPPSGDQMAQAVLLLQDGLSGDISTSAASVNYQNCPAGSQRASNERQYQCDACAPGRYSTGGGAGCNPCSAGHYSAQSGATNCTECPVDTYRSADDSGAATSCTACAANAYAAAGAKVCLTCAAGQYYAATTRSCETCPDGVVCGATVTAATGWYAYVDPDTGLVAAAPCSVDRCVVCADAPSDAAVPPNNTFPTCCTSGRYEAASNPLCGRCLPDHYVWGGECVQCTRTSPGFVVLFLVASWVYVVVFHRVSQNSRGDSRIFLNFVQLALVYFGGHAISLLFLQIFNFNALKTGGNNCVAPMSDLQRLLTGLYVPLLAFVLLFINWLTTYTVWWCYVRPRTRTRLPTTARDGRLSVVVRDGDDDPALRLHGGALCCCCAPDRGCCSGECPWICRRHINPCLEWTSFHASPYIRTALALCLFAYQEVTTTVFAFLDCTDVGSGSYVTAYPAINCDSDEYTSLRPLFLALTGIVVAGVPVAVLGWLLYAYRNGWINAGNSGRGHSGSGGANGASNAASASFGGGYVSASARAKAQSLAVRKTLARYGILHEAYTPQRFYYEFVVLVRRAVAVGVFTTSSDFLTRYSNLSIANVCFLLVHMSLRPYRRDADNHAESLALVVLTICTILLSTQSNSGGEFPTRYTNTFTVLVLGVAGLLALRVIVSRLWPEKGDTVNAAAFEQQANAADAAGGDGALGGLESPRASLKHDGGAAGGDVAMAAMGYGYDNNGRGSVYGRSGSVGGGGGSGGANAMANIPSTAQGAEISQVRASRVDLPAWRTASGSMSDLRTTPTPSHGAQQHHQPPYSQQYPPASPAPGAAMASSRDGPLDALSLYSSPNRGASGSLSALPGAANAAAAAAAAAAAGGGGGGAMPFQPPVLRVQTSEVSRNSISSVRPHTPSQSSAQAPGEQPPATTHHTPQHQSQPAPVVDIQPAAAALPAPAVVQLPPPPMQQVQPPVESSAASTTTTPPVLPALPPPLPAFPSLMAPAVDLSVHVPPRLSTGAEPSGGTATAAGAVAGADLSPTVSPPLPQSPDVSSVPILHAAAAPSSTL